MTLIEENKRTQKSNIISRVIGGVVVCIGLLFFAISTTSIIFPLNNFIDLTSFIHIALLEIGVILISKARTKEKILQLISKTILPVGLLTSIVSMILVLILVSDLDIRVLGVNLAVAILAFLYSLIIKILVEVLLAK